MISSAAERVHGPSLSFIQWQIQGRGSGGPGRNKNYGKHPRGKNEEGTQLGSDEWGTEWKYHGSKSIHCYQNQILNRNNKGNAIKAREKLTRGLTKLTTDKKRVDVQE